MELDESAVEFLIENGFTPDLGARPLKRALDRHLLTPIAEAIVEHAVPEGDQFLLVGTGPGGLDVKFVDPDATAEAERDSDAEMPSAMDLRALALNARFDERAVRFLLDEVQRIRTTVDGEIAARKDSALAAMQEPAFWEDDGRHAVLAEAEYLDRLQAAFATAGKLGERLVRHGGNNGAGELAELLSIRLYVLDAALAAVADGQATDVFLLVTLAGGDDTPEGRGWVDDLAAMYASWATRRGMRLNPLGQERHLYAVSGLGARTILEPEAGLHVLELVDEQSDGERVDRHHAHVHVAPWLPSPDHAPDGLVRRARAALGGLSTEVDVVRRYRKGRSPLVRDVVRGYRTGRLDRVMAGDFDLF